MCPQLCLLVFRTCLAKADTSSHCRHDRVEEVYVCVQHDRVKEVYICVQHDRVEEAYVCVRHDRVEEVYVCVRHDRVGKCPDFFTTVQLALKKSRLFPLCDSCLGRLYSISHTNEECLCFIVVLCDLRIQALV